MTLSKIDSLRFEYTVQRFLRKEPTVRDWEKLNDAVHDDLRLYVAARKRLKKGKPQQISAGPLFEVRA